MKPFYIIGTMIILLLSFDAMAHSSCNRLTKSLPLHEGLTLTHHNKHYCYYDVDQIDSYAPHAMFRRCEYKGSYKYHIREVRPKSLRGFVHVVMFKCDK